MRAFRNLWRRTPWARRRRGKRIEALQIACSGYTGDGDAYFQFRNGYSRWGILAEKAELDKKMADPEFQAALARSVSLSPTYASSAVFVKDHHLAALYQRSHRMQ